MKTRVIGSILLVLGTAIGAGMLALPVVTAHEGFLFSTGLIVICWAIMTISAFYLLEANLWLPESSNMISMIGQTLGVPYQVLAWICYLMLFYSLMCAYIAGGSDMLGGIFAGTALSLPKWLNSVIVVFVFGFLVCNGVSSVDKLNRGIMSIKILLYFLLVFSVVPHINLGMLKEGTYDVRLPTVMVMLTSFGFASILPTIRSYLNSDIKSIRTVILIGGLIPLAIYVIWIALVQGVLPRVGEAGLIQMNYSSNVLTDLTHGLMTSTNSANIFFFSKLFVSIATITSFLGVSLSLSDFFSDGLMLPKTNWGGLAIYALTFIPPLIMVIFAPGIFIKSLSYAGLLCVILFILFPALMVVYGRYKLGIRHEYRVWGGEALLMIMLVTACVLIISTVFHLIKF